MLHIMVQLWWSTEVLGMPSNTAVNGTAERFVAFVWLVTTARLDHR